MRTIGFRCEKQVVTYVVLEGTRTIPALVERERLTPPAGSTRGDQLSWLRREVQALLDRHVPDVASYKRTETIASVAEQRAEVEGVLKEACRSHSSRLELRSMLKQQILNELHFKKGTSPREILEQFRLKDLSTPETVADASIVALSVLSE